MAKPAPKAAPKQTVNAPNSRMNGAPLIYKQPPKPKEMPKNSGAVKPPMGDTGSQQHLIPTHGGSVGTDPYIFDPIITLPDGSKTKLPKKKRMY